MTLHIKQVWAALLGVALSAMPLLAAEASDCSKISQSVRTSVKRNPSKLLEIVSTKVAASPACSYEIVKSAIKASRANAVVVASIVEAAATASPENIGVIVQAAIDTVPGSSKLLLMYFPAPGNLYSAVIKEGATGTGTAPITVYSTSRTGP